MLDCFISAMFRYTSVLLLLFLVIAIEIHRSQQTLECVNPDREQIRTFSTIVKYQANKTPFDPRKAAWKGSTVIFNFTTINKLQKNVFIAYDSQYVLKMDLSGKQIEEIDDGAFISLDCLHVLRLDNNNISRLTKDSFEGLQSLEELDLSENRIEVIPDLAFNHTRKLQVLNLMKNKLKKLQALSFIALKNLAYLNLGYNELSEIQERVFIDLINLKELDLSFNKLSNIEPEKWLNLSSLEKLNLAGNSLNHFDSSYNFSFNHLKSLNLSNNQLSDLNVRALRFHFAELGSIDINNNSWYCDVLILISHQLADSRIRILGNYLSPVNVEGIACIKPAFEPHIKPTIETTTVMNTVIVNSSSLTDIEDLLAASQKVADSNSKLLESMNYLTHLVVVLFVLTVLFIVFEIFVRTDGCRLFTSAFQRNNERFYLDNRNIENTSLLNR